MDKGSSRLSPAAEKALTARAYQAFEVDALFRPHADWAFEFQETLGAGGMGVVHRVIDRRTRREAALKVLLEPRPELIERFIREARVSAFLDHPAVPPIYEYGRAGGGKLYILMKLVRGETLAEKIRRFRAKSGRPRDALANLLRVLLRVCEALGYAHSKGVIHRDLKPENIMVGRHGKTYLMDWGIARNLEESEDSDRQLRFLESQISDSVFENKLSVQGAIVGSPGYISPEQAAADDVSPASDIYALGAILFEIISGQKPVNITGTAGYIAAMEGRIDIPRGFGAGYPKVLAALALRCLKKEPACRPKDMDEVAAALREGIRVLGGRQRRVDLTPRALGAAALIGLGLATFFGLAARSANQARDAQQQRLAAVEAESAALKQRAEALAACEQRARDGLAARARLLNDLGRYREALELCRELEESAPGRADLYAIRGLACLELGQSQRSLDSYQRFFELSTERDSGLYNNRGKAYTKLGRYREALEDYDQAIVFAPQDPTLYSNRGDVFTRLGQHRRAIEDFNKALERDKDHAPAHAGKGLAYLSLKEHRLAIASFDKALALRPLARDFTNRGNAYSNLGEYRTAIADYNAAIARDQGDSDSYANRGYAYEVLGDSDRAMEDYNAALNINDKNTSALLNRGNLYFNRSEFVTAIADYDAIIVLEPRNTIAIGNRAAARVELGELERGLEDYQRALEIGTTDPTFWSNLALAYSKTEQTREALDACNKALEYGPDDAIVRLRRGQAALKLGRAAEALADLDRALALDPKLSEARELRQQARQALGKR